MNDLFILFEKKYHLSKNDLLAHIGKERIDAYTYFELKMLFKQLERGDIKPKNIKKTGAKESHKTKNMDEKELLNDKDRLIKQIYSLAKIDGILIEQIEFMLNVKDLKELKIDILDGMINEWDDIKEKLKPTEEKNE